VQTPGLLAQIRDFAETTSAAWLLSRASEGRRGAAAFGGLRGREEPVRSGEIAPPSKAQAAFLEALERALGEGDPLAERWHDLGRRLKLSSYELAALALLVGITSSPLLSRVLRESWAEAHRRSLPLGLMALLLADEFDGDGHASDAMELLLGRGTLFRCGILQRVVDGHPRCEQGVYVAESALDWLCGAMLVHRDYLGVLGEEPPERHRRVLGPALRQLTASREPIRAVLSGPEGSGRLAVASQLAHVLAPHAGVFRLELDRAHRQHAVEEDVATARAFAALTGALIVVTGADALAGERQSIQEAVVDAFRDLPVSLVWLVDSLSSETLKSMAVHPEHVLRLAAPTRAQRANAWRAALGEGLGEEAVGRLAGGFLLTEGQIVRAAREARASLGVGELPERLEERVAVLARGLANTGLGSLARPELCKFGLERLVLEPETRTLLDELVAYAKHRGALASRWGFDGTLSYGLGVTALFTGPPGTGKTLAATAIARELGQELYRVDLSQLVSKYIGETEKHLGALFDAAEQGEVVLLFDEADSVFGKRTEVKTSVDRYANLEVNYLLQRIERFDGVVVLTTNFESGIDEAFARRIRFRVAFDAPDVEARCALWRALIAQ